MSAPASPSPRGPAVGSPEQSPDERAAAYTAVAQSPEFRDLRARYRRFAFPTVIGCLAFYFLYVILAAYAHGFMSQPVVGSFNVGVIFGLLQFVMVFGVTAIYVRYSRSTLDPARARIREQMEAEGLR